MAALSKFLAGCVTPRNAATLIVASAVVWTLARKASANQKRRAKYLQNQDDDVSHFIHEPENKEKAAVDMEFFRQLRKIIKMIMPSWFSAEGWYVFLVALALGSRTFCDVWMIRNGTSIESSIISRNKELFLRHLLKFIYAMPAISIVNNILKYSLDELKLRFRTRLSLQLYSKYLKGFTYYKMTNLDNRVANADQLLTQDVEKLSNSIGELYSNLSKTKKAHRKVDSVGAEVGGGAEVNHLRNLIFFRFTMGLVDNIIAKYVATVVGYYVVSRPFLDLLNPRHANSSHSERLQDYYESGRMLVKMAEAIGRVVLAGRELTRLAGFTSRVTEFMNVLDDLNCGKYERTMVGSASNGGNKDPDFNLVPGCGELIIKDKIIKFEKVPLVTPNGDVLVRELSFEVRSGMNVLVCGPNGCGKSSLFRILGGLWPLFGGKLTKPDNRQLFYIPQRPYMTVGTLRDQIIYPHLKDEMNGKGLKDTDLEDILTKVQLSYILEREGGWDSVQDWMDVLSGGEKQRIAMARLFYHCPQFAILDECTSAVSVDVEGFMYQHCRQVGITLFTVSHRKSLWKHHEYYLHMDGRGSFTFKPITDETMEFGS
ncbi:hypothetical protein HELRODRAFT_187814 [Helobdella robusta]|uniref:ABC transporter domain-containing protein n=1 Tax=Helobdella robusta TaxID=6412 RepID=T1FPE3_HELRO|nr:hypothetical protein HELRODRAFT_187814 [Helobdella robusta]ESO12250.1 hypothetical protein HELRODRAFT_187814 [Helobdella robusta]